MSEKKDYQPCCKPRACRKVVSIRPTKFACRDCEPADWREVLAGKWNGALKT